MRGQLLLLPNITKASNAWGRFARVKRALYLKYLLESGTGGRAGVASGADMG